MLDRSAPIASRLRALLGPTNTGKTHRAVQRMLEFPSGMMGMPLRLLAREVYDRVSTEVGESRVALVTGEEKRVPRNPSYWVCTAESVPRDREVDFVAIDEIQLIAHPTRGHVFTHHLLNTRGRQETWFLGSDTARPLLERLVPTATIDSHPRLSRLSFAGVHALGKLPPRSAVVAFSLPRVYELAERLRARRGGAAVVLGALSPRTRNAQVAMYQAGEVDYLVATDAIGMGLNLAVEHVAFAGLSKFDGAEERELRPRELGQIAGRAGRHLANGTFGTLREGPRMPDTVVRAIESHQFEPERFAWWRSADLDFSSVGKLLASLEQTPHGRLLRRFDGGDDSAALRRLARERWIVEACVGEEPVRKLWAVCQIPDYRKLLPELHAELLLRVFEQLLSRGTLDDDWLERHVRALDDPRGDVDALTSRIAFVRTFTYLSQQPDFVATRGAWAERTRAIEDRLSDALHSALVQRFVDRTRRVSAGRGPRFAPLDASGRLDTLASAASHDWVQAVLDASAEALQVDADGRLSHGERVLGRLVAGRALLLPEVRLTLNDVAAGAKAQLVRRLVAWSRDLSERVGRGWYDEHGTAAVRGLSYQLLQNLGTVERSDVEAQVSELSRDERAGLEQRGIVFGRRFVWVKPLLERDGLTLRCALVGAFHGEAAPRVASGPSSLVRPERSGRALALALGYAELGPRWVRCDIAERAAAHRDDPTWEPGRLCGLLGCRKSELKAVLRALESVQTGVNGSPRERPRINREHVESLSGHSRRRRTRVRGK